MKMPSEEEETESRVNMVELLVTKDWLCKELRSNPSRLVILDCRSSNEFGELHIRQAVNFSIPSIMLRRLAAGKIDLLSTIKSRDLKHKIKSALKENVFVVYGDLCFTESKTNQGINDTINILTKRLIQDGCRVVCLEDGFAEFRCCYPEWCESVDDSLSSSDPELPLMGLRSLRISSLVARCNKGSETCSCEPQCEGASLALEDDALVEILPHLFLGNAANSEDLETLTKHNIKYILNVTPDLPNVFESTGEFKYMKIPIFDHWSQNLASYFPKSIEFIEEARCQEKGILVHCVAGVSRSVTITVAYLMARLNLTLNDAFSLVRTRKPNIAPNFHFMEQLDRFEKELEGKKGPTGGGTGSGTGAATGSAATFLSPLSLGQSPDSGIEFDRWTPGTGE